MKSKTDFHFQNKGKSTLFIILLILLFLVISSFGLIFSFSEKYKRTTTIRTPDSYIKNKKTPVKEKFNYQSDLGNKINQTLINIGIPETDISISRTERMDHNTPRVINRYYVEVPSIYPLAFCNLIVTKSINDAGAEVIKAIETRSSVNGLKKVLMDIGEDELITEQVIMLEKPTPKEVFTMPKFKKGGKIAFIIDDFGYSYNSTAQAFLRINRPLTISVLPMLPSSQTIAEDATFWGHQVLLHLPMEAEQSVVDPGKYGIYNNTPIEEIRQRIQVPLNKMPQVIGVNNHMGSKVTKNKTIMTAVLRKIKEEDLFYIDSMTTPESIGWQLARELNIKTARNKGFIDSKINKQYIKRSILKIARIASREGSAICIGHPHHSTLQAIQEMIPVLENQGFELVYVSELIK